jgi:hypothetical protein
MTTNSSNLILEFLVSRWNYFLFKSMLWMSSLGFYSSRAYQWLLFKLTGKRSDGFEAWTDAAVKKAFEEQFGLTLDPSVFEG